MQLEYKSSGNKQASALLAGLTFCWQPPEHFTLPRGGKMLKAICSFSTHIINRFSKQCLSKLPAVARLSKTPFLLYWFPLGRYSKMIAKTIKTEVVLQSWYISDFSVTSISLPPKKCSRNDNILVSYYFFQSGFISRSSELLGQTRHGLRSFLSPTICLLLCWWCTPVFLSNHPVLWSMNSEMSQCPDVKVNI